MPSTDSTRKPKSKPKLKPEPALISPSPAIRRRHIKESRDIWLDFFSSSLSSMLTQFLDDDMASSVNWEVVSARLAKDAATVADAGLNETEERFPGL